MENNILKRKLVDNGLLYTPIVVPDVLKRLSPDFGTRQARPQRIQMNICIFKKQILLEGYEEVSVSTLHKLPSLCKTQHQNSAAEK